MSASVPATLRIPSNTLKTPLVQMGPTNHFSTTQISINITQLGRCFIDDDDDDDKNDDGDNNISKLQSSTLSKTTMGGHFPIPEHSTYAKDRYIRQVTPIPVHGCPSTFSHQSLNTSGGVISAVGSTHGLTIESEE